MASGNDSFDNLFYCDSVIRGYYNNIQRYFN